MEVTLRGCELMTIWGLRGGEDGGLRPMAEVILGWIRSMEAERHVVPLHEGDLGSTIDSKPRGVFSRQSAQDMRIRGQDHCIEDWVEVLMGGLMGAWTDIGDSRAGKIRASLGGLKRTERVERQAEDRCIDSVNNLELYSSNPTKEPNLSAMAFIGSLGTADCCPTP